MGKHYLLWLCLSVLCRQTANAQNDERQVRQFLKAHMPAIENPEKVWLFQCRYKAAKTWQYLVTCINTVDSKPMTTLLFAERINDSTLHVEPFHFSTVEAFDHVNMDDSRDRVEELYITTATDSGNLARKTTGIYSCKDGFIDTLITFQSFGYKVLPPPAALTDGLVVEQEEICQLTDVDDDGKIDLANRVHRKIYHKDPVTDAANFAHETDYIEYHLEKGRFVPRKPKAAKSL